jgi:hypothetical protein
MIFEADKNAARAACGIGHGNLFPLDGVGHTKVFHPHTARRPGGRDLRDLLRTVGQRGKNDGPWHPQSNRDDKVSPHHVEAVHSVSGQHTDARDPLSTSAPTTASRRGMPRTREP